MAYLQITLNISNHNRPAAANVYQKYKAPFLNTIAGATSKNCLFGMKTCKFYMALKLLLKRRRILPVNYLQKTLWKN